jgi:hypothetical protein
VRGAQDHYTPSQPGIQRMVFKLRELVFRVDGESVASSVCAPQRRTAETTLPRHRRCAVPAQRVSVDTWRTWT